jgi:hypothetical protein
MAQEPAIDSKPQESNEPPPNAGKLVISSIMTHDKLLGMIKERNPIIASRDQPKR